SPKRQRGSSGRPSLTLRAPTGSAASSRFTMPPPPDQPMPELPDVAVYLDCLRPRVVGRALDRVRVANPFLVRTYDPPLSDCHGKAVRGLRRLGKRLVFGLDDDLFLVLHLMIAGRLHWKPPGAKVP